MPKNLVCDLEKHEQIASWTDSMEGAKFAQNIFKISNIKRAQAVPAAAI